MGYLDAQAGDEGRTAFRKAEKRYKHYKNYSSAVAAAGGSNKLREKVPLTDLTEVLDFKIIQGDDNHAFSHRIKKIEGEYDWPVFTMEGHPGFYFIPQALGVKEQMYWIQESLLNFPQPPNRTNHTAFHGHIYDLWKRAMDLEVLTCSDRPEGGNSYDHRNSNNSSLTALDNSEQGFIVKTASTPGTEDAVSSEVITSEKLEDKVFAKSLLRKLRWATLGLQFDWSKRSYDLSLPYREIPSKLSGLAAKLAEPALKEGKFLAEAAIVNYFGPDDMLGGHLDDMEADWNKPIVSISLGCKAIFLLGGPSKDELPTAMFLRSGDVVLMAGPARGCYHGVPRIFVGADSELPDFLDATLFAPFVGYIKDSRININIRQVF